ncbi:HAMP domain-containing histidine kinase, partial [Candidatus Saccharibacteria bacterium]|nr:HAMP domain-containing histidine kinase [Candidatus Saccharibacteria bacterium]
EPFIYKISDELRQSFISDINQVILLALLITLPPAILVALIISDRYLIQSRRIKRGLEDVRVGKLDKLQFSSNITEIDDLVRAFNGAVEALNRVEKLRDDLIGDISHEIATPLTKLKVQVSAIRDGLYQPTEQKIATLLEEVDYLDFLVNRLRHYSEIRSIGEVNKQEITLQSFVKKISKSYPGLDTMIEIDKDFRLMADKNYLREILENLLSNADKYADPKRVKISANQDSIRFQDFGPGISKKDLPYIFERLYRVEKSRNRQTGGMGLGLAIVQTLVEAHGWRISVESDGSGTTFIINSY